MLHKVVRDLDTLSSDVGEGPATSTLNPSRRRHHQSNQQTRPDKRQRKVRRNGP